MRIVIDHFEFFSNNLNPCAVGGTGEAEDYTLYVSNTVSCLPPSALLSSNVTTTSVDLAWTAGATETEWQVIYGATGFDPNTAGSTATVNGTPSTTISGLTSDTQYDFYVLAVCAVNDLSVKIGPNSIRTLCSATTVPYTMDFENLNTPAIDFCTSIENAGSGNDWATAFLGSNGFVSNVLRYSYHANNNANAWFFTQGIQLTAGTNYTISYKYGNNSTTYSEQLSIAYGTTPASASMTGYINQHAGITGGQASTGVVNFTVLTTDVYYFGFQAGSLANQHFLYLDDINVYVSPTCLAPSLLSVANISTTDADLSWTAGGTETEWDVIYGPAGFDPTVSGTPVNVTGTPQTTITGLNPNTQYEYYVTAVCSPVDESSMTGPKSFETNCTTTTVPYFEGFESVTLPGLPYCTTNDNVGTGNDWKTVAYTSNGFTGNVLNYASNAFNDANTWFYTQGIELQAGVDYEISYTYGSTATYTEKMKVAFGTITNAGAMVNQLADFQNINNSAAIDTTQTFTVASNGVYFFGFNAYSDLNQNNLYLDNINIVEKQVCDAVTGLAVTDVENEQATVSWTASATATAGYEVEVYLAGEDPTTATPVVTEIVAEGVTTVSITGLTAGVSYDVYIVADCDQIGSTRSSLVNFTTSTVGLESNELMNVSFAPNPVSSVLNINAESVIETVVVYNITGKAVIEVKGNKEAVSVDMSSLSNGTYIVKALISNSISTFKVVKH